MPSKNRRRRWAVGSISTDPNHDADGQGAGKGSFYFVNVDPSLAVENSLNRSFIRSHAGRHVWREHHTLSNGEHKGRGVRTVSLDSGRNIPPKVARSTSSSDHSSQIADLDTCLSESPEQTPQSLDQDDEPRPLYDGEGEGDDILVDQLLKFSSNIEIEPWGIAKSMTSLVQGHQQLSRNLLENGVADPFHTYPSNHGENAASKWMSYSVTELWPTLLPGLASGAPNTEAEVAHWLSRALTSPALFDAFMYGAATHMQTRRRLGNIRIEPQTDQEKRELIISEAETIKHLNRVMQNPSYAITDETILAVLCMGFNRVDGSAWPGADPPLKPPLRNLQWLNVYGTLSGNEIHVRGMIKLIEMKGGLESLKMPGLAETVSFASILIGSKRIEKPAFGFVPLVKLKPGSKASSIKASRTSCSAAFSQDNQTSAALDDFVDVGLTSDLVNVLRDMNHYNAMVRFYSQGIMPSLDMAVLADKRNLTQHRLLSLPSAYDFDEKFFPTHKIYESTRLAAIMFSLLVLFPLPAATAPFTRLAQMLKTALIDSELKTSWRRAPKLLLWILIVGGVGSMNTPDRSWYVVALSRLTAAANIKTWGDLKTVVMPILWLDCTCDAAGQALWNEIVG